MDIQHETVANGHAPADRREDRRLETLLRSQERPVRKEFLAFGAPDIREPEIQEVVEVLRSGWLGTGPRCQQFEALFCDYLGCGSALALNSCTAGLELALELLGIGPGDDVITTPLTFCATSNVIVHRGARPVFVDVDPSNATIDPDHVRRAVTPRTKAILPVHLYGYPCAMDALTEIAREHGLAMIEDAAHATEAWYHGRRIGTFGDFGVFSFYVTKNMTTGEGGMLVTDNAEWAEQARLLRLHGLSRDAWKRYSSEGFQAYDVLAAGYKYNMTDMQAALGIHQLERLEPNLPLRERYWRRYNEAFADLDEVTLPAEVNADPSRGRTRHARHLYTLLLNLDRLTISRDEFIAAMKAENIGTGIHYLALHRHTFYQQRFAYRQGDFPHAESIADRTVSLPLSPKLSEEDVWDVIRAVRKVIARSRIARFHGR